MLRRTILLALGLGVGTFAGCRDSQDTENPSPPSTRAACCRAICACFGTEPPPDVWAAHQEAVGNCHERGLDSGKCGCTDALTCP